MQKQLSSNDETWLRESVEEEDECALTRFFCLHSQTDMDKRARKLFRDFTDASISRVEASRKRTHGNNPFIDATFAYISSRSDDDSHYFGHVVEKDKKPPCKTVQPVFYKLDPETEEEYNALINRLSRLRMTMDAFLPPRVRKNRVAKR
jgi:hypothetical protein